MEAGVCPTGPLVGRSIDGATPAMRDAHQVSGLSCARPIRRGTSSAYLFFGVTLGRGRLMTKTSPVRVPQTLPVVLSRDEVARLIGAVTNLKHQTDLTVAYGAGLRAGEVIALKVGDIDSQRMTLRVEQVKGAKDRYAMLSPLLLERLRACWRAAPARSPPRARGLSSRTAATGPAPQARSGVSALSGSTGRSWPGEQTSRIGPAALTLR